MDGVASREEDDSEPDVRFEKKTRSDGHRSQPLEPAQGGGDLERLALQTPRPKRKEVWVGWWGKTSKGKTRGATKTDESDGKNASESPERRRGQTRRRWRSQVVKGTGWTMVKVSDDE